VNFLASLEIFLANLFAELASLEIFLASLKNFSVSFSAELTGLKIFLASFLGCLAGLEVRFLGNSWGLGSPGAWACCWRRWAFTRPSAPSPCPLPQTR
jgi:hypothetical protein